MKEKCLNCGEELAGKYCFSCGQKKFDHSQKTIPHLIHDAFHFITHLDGNIITSVKTIYGSPGKYALNYCKGIQKRYFKPISLFLIIVILYLFFPLLKGMNMELQNHKGMIFYGSRAERQIENKIKTDNSSVEDLSERYHKKSEKVSKILLLILLPLTAWCLQLIFFDKKLLFYDHLILSTEINIFYLATVYLILPLILILLSIIPGITKVFSEMVLLFLTSLILAVFSGIAAKRFYKIGLSRAMLSGVALSALHIIFVQVVYRFLLFEISLLLA